MNEQSMKCKDCVLKHIANAMSYAKEILAGHGIGGTPDHRPDYLGELVNAENHLEHISIELLNRVMVLRTAAQMRRMVPLETDIDELRELWIAVEAVEVPEGIVAYTATSMANPTPVSSTVKEEPKKMFISAQYPDMEKIDTVGVVLDTAWFKEENKEKYEIFMNLANKNMRNGIILDRESLKGYSEKYLWVFPLDIYINREADMRIPVVGGLSGDRKKSFIMRVVDAETYKDRTFTHPTESPSEIIDNMDIPIRPNMTEEYAVVYVTRKPCCSIKSRLGTQSYVKVNDEGWPYMKEIWGIN